MIMGDSQLCRSSGQRRLFHLARHLSSAITCEPTVAAAKAVATVDEPPLRPTMAKCAVFPTGDPDVAFSHLRRKGFCVLFGVLSEAEMVPLRQRLLEVSSRPEHSRAGIESALHWSPADGLEAHFNDLSEQLQKIQVRCPILFLCSMLRGRAGGGRAGGGRAG
eukprot:SAG11_NODE_8873_length_967_cov_8.881336_1_plen_163_part_00